MSWRITTELEKDFFNNTKKELDEIKTSLNRIANGIETSNAIQSKRNELLDKLNDIMHEIWQDI